MNTKQRFALVATLAALALASFIPPTYLVPHQNRDLMGPFIDWPQLALRLLALSFVGGAVLVFLGRQVSHPAAGPPGSAVDE